ncbi:drug/metabolite transporter (DMT)-like permease [Phreatobacter oligotrophus]|uniref:Drug/metabolite transporter (DMT)-like permease n=2 Tax=Phreatobacter oligotrophus TaxID=1122261 RepID=A0A2T4YZC7_9HYPH|nr:drug/metabolite transporter (DMT)-like permease [Phreatobacter oligotrophus]
MTILRARWRKATRPMAETRPAAPASRDALMGLACGAGAALIWGIQAVVSRRSVGDGLGPVDVTLLRFLTAAAVLIPFGLMRLKPFPVGRLGWKRSLVLTLFAGAPFSTVLVGGSTFAPALHTAVIAPSLIPVVTALIAYAAYRETSPPARILGLVLIVTGIALVAGQGLIAGASDGAWRGDLLFVLASTMWAIFGILAKRWQADALDITITLSILSLAVLPLLALAVPLKIASAGMGAIALQAIYQGLLVGIASVFLYATANQRLGAARASLFLPLVPAITAVASAILLGEWPSASELIGMAVVMTGMTIAIRA